MFTVTGMYKGKPYGVAIGNELTGKSWGLAAGTLDVLALLASREGSTLRVTPTGPLVKVDKMDAASLLGALHVLTEVVSVEGSAPPVIPLAQEGFVY